MKFENFSINRGRDSGIFRNIPEKFSQRPNDPPTRPDRKTTFRPPTDDDPDPNRLGMSMPTSLCRPLPPMINGKSDLNVSPSCETRPGFRRRFRPPPVMKPLGFSSSPPQQPPCTLGSSSQPPYAADRTREDFWIRNFGGNFRPFKL